jgi:hypothetical protein
MSLAVFASRMTDMNISKKNGNPLFLDDLRARLEEAGDNARMLLNLRKRLAKLRVFDPACGSGNFLVIAYKAMREIEAEINKRRGEADHRRIRPPACRTVRDGSRSRPTPTSPPAGSWW